MTSKLELEQKKNQQRKTNDNIFAPSSLSVHLYCMQHVCHILLLFQLLLRKAATDPHDIFSGRNKCASVLNGPHLFPLRVLKQQCYPPGQSYHYFLLCSKREDKEEGYSCLNCKNLVQPDSTACWSGCRHTQIAQRVTRTVCRATPHSFSVHAIIHAISLFLFHFSIPAYFFCFFLLLHLLCYLFSLASTFLSPFILLTWCHNFTCLCYSASLMKYSYFTQVKLPTLYVVRPS